MNYTGLLGGTIKSTKQKNSSSVKSYVKTQTVSPDHASHAFRLKKSLFWKLCTVKSVEVKLVTSIFCTLHIGGDRLTRTRFTKPSIEATSVSRFILKLCSLTDVCKCLLSSLTQLPKNLLKIESDTIKWGQRSQPSSCINSVRDRIVKQSSIDFVSYKNRLSNRLCGYCSLLAIFKIC